MKTVRQDQVWLWQDPKNAESTAKIKIIKVNRNSYPGVIFTTLESTSYHFTVNKQDTLYIEFDKTRYGSIECFLKHYGYRRVR